MKIGIFGGSFNPPHKMHKSIAKNLIKKGYVDQVIFVPTGTKYEYKTNLISNEKRVDMLSLMIEKEKNMTISKYELRQKPVYTYETLKHFKKKYKEDDIYFICGTDNLSYIDKWKNGKEILKNYKLLIIKRETDEIEPLLEKYKKYRQNIIVTKVKEKTVSSTKIRTYLKQNNSLKAKLYIDRKVYNYIRKNHLYEEKKGSVYHVIKSY